MKAHPVLTTPHGLVVEDVLVPCTLEAGARELHAGDALARHVRWRCRGCGLDRRTWVTEGGRPMTPAEVEREHGRHALRLMGDEVYSYGPDRREFYGLAVVGCGQCSQHTVLSQHAYWRIGREHGRRDIYAAMECLNEKARVEALRRLPPRDRKHVPLLPLPPEVES